MTDTLAIIAEAARAAESAALAWRGRRGRSLRAGRAGHRRRRLPPPCRHRPPRRRPTATGWPRTPCGRGIRVAADDTWSDIFSRILVEKIEPELGFGRPTILQEYPVAEAALARVSPRDPRVAERFELYACGVELANGFAELTDPAEQRRRFAAEMDEKARVHGERYPLDEDFLAALAAMPEASGVALGLDRLVMLATGAPRIDLVQWTPVDAGEENAMNDMQPSTPASARACRIAPHPPPTRRPRRRRPLPEPSASPRWKTSLPATPSRSRRRWPS